MPTRLDAVVMAGGLGTRMRSSRAKHLHPILGRRMVDWVLEAARPLQPERIVVVASPDTAAEFEGVDVAVQEVPLGTGDALRSARGALSGAAAVLVLSGDTPLLTSTLVSDLVAAHASSDAAVTVLSFVPEDVRRYGRIVRDDRGGFVRIVEASDATPEELEIREANSSIYVFAARALWPAIEALTPANAQGELYLTDAVSSIVEAGGRVAVHVADDPHEAEGVNTREELAAAGAALRDRINREHMHAGVTIVDPPSTWIEPTVSLEPDAVVHPFTTLRGATSVAAGAEIGPHVVAIDSTIGPHALVGPFCYLRPGTVLEVSAKAGTFVELKNTVVGEGAKVPHLAYMGDADIGAGANIGAGSITANLSHHPEQGKSRTRIGRDVKVAVDTMFVAPVTLGDDAWTAPGTVVTDDVPDNALVGFAPKQTIKEGRGGKRND
jgi:bifunctional UDP-N-acetylglucosamine pyrophosphorylase/glucosamine-1-phosphate N-acetyltransferase